MSINVAGAQFLCYQIFEGTLRPESSKVHHDRHARDLAGFDRILHGSPLRACIVRSLKTDYHVFVPRGHFGGLGRIHVLQVLLGIACHSRPDDVQHGEYARAGLDR